MDHLGGFLVLASIVVAVVSLVAIIRPIARLGLGSRKRALVVFVLSFVGFVTGGNLVSNALEERQPRTVESDHATTEQAAPKAAQSDVDDNASPSIQAGNSIPKEQGQQEPANGEPDSADESSKYLPDENFSIKISKEDKAGIWLTVDTTLPDHVDVRVSISRAIIKTKDEKIVGDDGITVNRKQEKAWFSYFSEREEVEQWKKPRFIRIDDLKWLRELSSRLDKSSVAGVPYKIDEITDEIEVSAYAYRNRTGDPYEKREYKSQSERYLKDKMGKKERYSTVSCLGWT